MKKILFAGILVAMNWSAGAVDFSGTYSCKMVDNADGSSKSLFTLKLNPLVSKLDQGYASYDTSYSTEGLPYSYTGIAASHGNELAVYFESVGDKKDPSDRGVGIGTVIMDQDGSGKIEISMHNYYYQKMYKGHANYGTANCIKTE